MSQTQAVEQIDDEVLEEALSPGTSLLRGQYEIIRFLNSGGFGITYLARDSLERDVVIKECFPGALCHREGDNVVPNAQQSEADLKSIIQLFIQEARSHAKLVHPNIVPVHQVFEDNNTAYIAMDYIRGYDLLDYLDLPDTQFTPEQFVSLTEKMLSAVSFIHDNGMLHRDISPDNILIAPDGEPILIDFGAAREQAAHKSAALVTLRVVKDGYSPQEFYVPGSIQGPYSDLYVLAATLYHVITGEPPADGKTRFDAYDKQIVDPYVPLTGRYKDFPAGFLEALDKAMSVMPAQRQQSALEWLRMFRGPQAMFNTTVARPASVIAALDEAEATPPAAEQAEIRAVEVEERIQADVEKADAAIAAMMADTGEIALAEPEPETVAPPAAPAREESPELKRQKAMIEEDEADLSEEEPAEPETAAAVFDELLPQEEEPAKKKTGLLLVGVAAVALLAGAGIFLTGGSDEADTPVAVAETQAEEPVAEAPEETPVATETASVAEETPAPTPEPVEETPAEPVVVAEETATAEVAAEEVTSPTATVLQNQIAYSHWDVDVPFTTRSRRVANGEIYLVESINASADLTVIGAWLSRGTAIYSVNNRAASANSSLASMVLSSLQIGRDGYTRAQVRYRAPGNARFLTGELALPVMQLIGLANGVTLTENGAENWQLKVTNAGNATGDGLRNGDILMREETTGASLMQRGALSAVLSSLIERGDVSEARFVVNRNGAQVLARMPLATE